MEFKPGEEYDLTDEQKKRVMERYLRKEKLKRDYLSMQYNPQRYNYIQGVVVSQSFAFWYDWGFFPGGLFWMHSDIISISEFASF